MGGGEPDGDLDFWERHEFLIGEACRQATETGEVHLEVGGMNIDITWENSDSEQRFGNLAQNSERVPR